MSANLIVYSPSDVSVGDTIAYPGRTGNCARGERDWLLVTHIKGGDVLGRRVHPEDWESDVEYAVFQRQIEANGVEIAAVSRSGSRDDA